LAKPNIRSATASLMLSGIFLRTSLTRGRFIGASF
jgi:hypothetical protein